MNSEDSLDNFEFLSQLDRCNDPDIGISGDDDDPIENCGRHENGDCVHLGTEFCDFECPFRDLDLGEILELIEIEGIHCNFDDQLMP